MTRIVRKDYDKPNRCPSWAGPGIIPYFFEKDLPDCDNGQSGYYDDDCNLWHFHECSTCGVKTFPIFFNYFDPQWWLRIKAPRWRYRVVDFLTQSKYVGGVTPFMRVVNFFKRR